LLNKTLLIKGAHNIPIYALFKTCLASKSIQQLVRYAVVGGGINLLLYLGYLLIHHWGLDPKISMSLIYALGVCIGFFSHRKWTFAQTGDTRKSIIRFLCAHAMGYCINFLILFIFVDHFAYPHAWVQGISIFVVAIFLFIIFKYWVFHGKNDHVSNEHPL
jgi:putative flippase GtrA